MHNIAEQLRDKNKVHLDYERTFLKDLKSKELDQSNLTLRIKELQNELNEKCIKLEYLEKNK